MAIFYASIFRSKKSILCETSNKMFDENFAKAIFREKLIPSGQICPKLHK
jgi:hypothetical protein